MKRHIGHALASIALAGYWSAQALASQFVVNFPQPFDALWHSAAPSLLGIGFAFAVGLYVGKWWVLLAAISPLIPLAALERAGHVAPYGDEGRPLGQWELLLASIVIPLAIGVAIRKGLGPFPGRSPRAHNSSV